MLKSDTNLQRFLDAQEGDYQIALAEIRQGKKSSHWMWYIFPQISGLGFSDTSKYYAIRNKAEAISFLEHPVLGLRLTAICTALLMTEGQNAHKIFGSPDDMKLQSCLTLFSALPGAPPIFYELLKKFFNGERDQKTLDILGSAAGT